MILGNRTVSGKGTRCFLWWLLMFCFLTWELVKQACSSILDCIQHHVSKIISSLCDKWVPRNDFLYLIISVLHLLSSLASLLPWPLTGLGKLQWPEKTLRQGVTDNCSKRPSVHSIYKPGVTNVYNQAKVDYKQRLFLSLKDQISFLSLWIWATLTELLNQQ